MGAKRAVAVVLVLTLAAGCRERDERRAREEAELPASETAHRGERGGGGAVFVDGSREAGLDFVHFNGMSGEYYYPEMMGPGGALFDFDGDGDLDAYLVQGEMLGAGKTLADALFPPRHPAPLTDRLFRNELGEGGGGLRFTDVTAGMGVAVGGYGVGVVAGDVDNDGRADLYVTAFGPNRMLRNRGGGSFEEVTARAGTDDPRWSVPAVFFDYDRDGWLDLYVGNYLDFTLGTHKACFDAAGARDYCGPTAYGGVPDRLFRNRGDGTFDDVSLTSGIGGKAGRTMGAVAADLDADGWSDLYVANDGEPNFLWINQRDGTFRDLALAAGCAVNEEGRAQASMGVDAGDFDNDGDDDLFMTHLTGETNALFANDGRASFQDLSHESGLALPSWPYTGFGARWFDLDSDGWLDLLTVNGAVRNLQELAQRGDPYPLHQRKQLFINRGDGSFADRGDSAGPVFALSEVGRGAAFGDVDNDGDPDVLVVNNNGPARLLINRASAGNHWIGLRVVSDGGRDALGARVAVRLAGGAVRWRRVASDGSYASASDPRVVVGLGQGSAPVEVTVVWPDGASELWRDLEADRYHLLERGGGERGGGG